MDNQEILVQIKFSKDTEVGQFSDALYFGFEEYKNITQKMIDEVINTRVQTYIDSIKNPPAPEVIPVSEKLQDIMKGLDIHYEETKLTLLSLIEEAHNKESGESSFSAELNIEEITG